ncbi:hypothetical protein EOPP23_12010 [Endozoicomonas sp. OPT23]|uniref:hypothetical protein n=1 Tax=Endozoicomonas sp. OPT23 TaxID=2072845 RepID=UPI00129BB5AA|nr:hypothetical protein [Endozoicomonas sp. OPT23]MRI33711.1 hypothetical protein [Endozoicomonas sp. OPT23]
MKLFILLVTLFQITGLLAESTASEVEHASEYIKVYVRFHSSDSGIFTAYKCPTCPPKNYTFNHDLSIRGSSPINRINQLKAADGKPGVIFFLPGSRKASGFMPIQ